MLTFDELWSRLLERDESIEIEAKECRESLGKSILETISAFANEPNRDGGYIVLGARRKNDGFPITYEKLGVNNPDQLQSDLAGQCRELFSAVIRPHIIVEQQNGKTFLVIHIPEAQAAEKPVYIKTKGLPKGAFRRIGSTDQACTDEDINLFYQLRSHNSYDETVVPGTTIDDFDPDALASYRKARAKLNPNAPELDYSDKDLLFALAATTRHQGELCATIAGLLLFGKAAAIRRHFPMTRIDYIRVQGREWVPDAENRFQITVEISGCLMNTIPRAISTVLDDIPKVFSLSGEDIHRRDVPMVPQNVIREAIVNALMHRNYRMRQPVQLIRYANRLEIRNPGFSLIPDERLGQPGSLTRNDKIAAALHEVGFAETKGSGIRSMRSGMEKAHLTPPIFESDRQKDAFTVTLLTHHLYGEEDVRWLGRFKEHNLSEDEAFALIYTKEVGFISNAIYRNINHVDSLTASSHLCRLRDVGLLVQDGKGSATSYRLPETLYSEKPSGQQIMLGPLNMELSHGSKDSGDNNLSPKHYLGRKGLSPESNLGDKLSKPALKELSQELESQVKQLGQRATPADVMLVIEKLCNWMPLQGIEIAAFIERDHDYVRKNYLGPMIRADRLRYLYPEHPNRPDQAYIGPESIEVK